MTLLEKKIENELLYHYNNVRDAQVRVARIMEKYNLNSYTVTLDDTQYEIHRSYEPGGDLRIIVDDVRPLFPDQWEFRDVLLRLLVHV